MDKYLHLAATLLNNGHIEEALTVLRHKRGEDSTKTRNASGKVTITNRDLEDELSRISTRIKASETHSVLNLCDLRPSITIYFTVPMLQERANEVVEKWAFGVWGRNKVEIDFADEEEQNITVYVRLDK